MADIASIVTVTLQTIVFIVLYLMIGFGPGFIIGMLLANRFIGRGKPLRMDSHLANIQKAAEQNKKWDPYHERWQKE